MNNKIHITEEDIFNYVLYPNSLDEEKRKYIYENQTKFAEQIDFCNTMKQPINGGDQILLNEMIAERFISKDFIARLFPQSYYSGKAKYEIKTLAAASGKSKNVIAETFRDKDSNFLVRYLKEGRKQTLNIFAKDEKQNHKLEIKVLPTGKEFNISDLSEAIVFDDETAIEGIEIKNIE